MSGTRSRSQRVTLSDVAELAGVSVTTASFVLSGRTDMRISTATADRVERAARTLDYVRPFRSVPNGSGIPVLGIMSDRIASGAFAGELLEGALLAAAEREHAVVIAQTDHDRAMEKALVSRLVDQGVDAFVYAALATQTARLPASLRTRRTVQLNCVDRTAALPAVLPDEDAAGATAAETLLRAGHGPRIWLVGEVAGWPYAGRRRAAGLAARLREEGHTVARHVRCPWWPEPARAAVAAAITGATRARRPTAVVALNDRTALGVYQAAAALGWSVPGDLSVVSFDNSDLAQWLDPALTSVDLPYLEMGRRAVELLLDGPAQPGVETLPMRLNDRDSVGPPPA